MLVSAKPDTVEKFVDLSLQIVCDKERLAISEYNVDGVMKTCEFMKGEPISL